MIVGSVSCVGVDAMADVSVGLSGGGCVLMVILSCCCNDSRGRIALGLVSGTG